MSSTTKVGASLTRDKSELDRSRFLVLKESRDRAVREDERAVLALCDHEFDLVRQELACFRGVVDLAAALRKIPGGCREPACMVLRLLLARQAFWTS